MNIKPDTPAPDLVILAAGMGSRYGGLKQLAAVGPAGETIMDYSIQDAAAAGFGRVIFVIRRDFETDFKARFSEKTAAGMETRYVFQAPRLPGQNPARTKPWGTGHAVLAAEKEIRGPFAVINADDYYGAESFARMAQFLKTSCAPDRFGMVAWLLKNTVSENGAVSRGICRVNAQNELEEVVEYTHIRPSGEGRFYDERKNTHLPADARVSMNFWGFHPAIFPLLRTQFDAFTNTFIQDPTAEFYLPAAINECIQNKTVRVQVMPDDSPWFGLTHRADFERVAAGIRAARLTP